MTSERQSDITSITQDHYSWKTSNSSYASGHQEKEARWEFKSFEQCNLSDANASVHYEHACVH